MKKTKQYFHSFAVITSVIVLTACSATEIKQTVGDTYNNVAATITGSEAPAWASAPLIAESQCNSFSYKNVENFLAVYASKENYSLKGTANEAGQRAMGTYMISAALINKAQTCMAEALELKETITLLEEEKKIILSGTSLSESEITRHREISAEANEAIVSYSQQVDELSPQKSESLVLGISTFLTGTYTTVRMEDAIADYTKKVAESSSNSAKSVKNNNSPTAWLNAIADVFDTTAGGGATIANIGSGLVPHMKKLYSTGEYLMEYSRKNNLTLPSNATEEFMSMGGWGDEE